MAIAIDASPAGLYQATGTTNTVSVTVSGSDRILVVFCVAGGRDISGVTYNGVALTELLDYDNEGSYYYTSLYYLVAPDTGTHNLVMTIASSGLSVLVGLSCTGVDQATPFNTYGSDKYDVDGTDRGKTLTTTVDGCGVFTGVFLDNRSVVAGDANSTVVNGATFSGSYFAAIARSATFPQTTKGAILVTLDGGASSWGRDISWALAPTASTPVTVSATTVTATASIPTYSVTAVQNVVVTVATQTLNVQVNFAGYPIIRTGVSVVATVASVVISVAQPTILADGNIVVIVGTKTLVVSIPAYTATAEGGAVTVPNTQSVTTSTVTPVVSTGTGASVAANVAVVTASVSNTVAVSGERNAEVVVSPVTLSASVIARIKAGGVWSRSPRATAGGDWTRSAKNYN
jgi:hypothetical protein